MKSTASWLLLVLLPVGIAHPDTAVAEPFGIKDGAQLLKVDTLRKVSAQIEQIRERFQTNVFIETVPALPAEQQKLLKDRRMDARARHRFFEEWAQKQAQQAKADGIYLWICKEPLRTEVVVGPGVSGDQFSRKNAERVAGMLSPTRFGKNPKYDVELPRALTYVADTLDGATRPAIWPWVLGIMLAVLGIWLVIALLRPREPEAEATPAPHGQVASAMPGGMLGAAGGLGIYQSLLDKKHRPAENPSVPENPTTTAPVEDHGDYSGPEDANPADSHAPHDADHA